MLLGVNKMTSGIYKLFLLYNVVNLSTSTFCAPLSSDKCTPCPQIDYEKIPPYILYILGFQSILLILVLIILIYVLIKTKFLKRYHTTSLTEKVENGGTVFPSCQNLTAGTQGNMKKNCSDLNIKSENTSTIKRQDSKVSSIISDHNTLRNPVKADNTINITPRIVKGNTKDLPYILPEQMSLICKEVLKRAKTDSSNSLHNIDQLVNEAKLKDETLSKSASTPVLDICHNPPRTPQLTTKKYPINSDSEDVINRSSKRCIDKVEPDFEIYDFPKESCSIYDTVPKENTKLEHKFAYVTPCFENQPPPGQFQSKEKENYAEIKDPSEYSPVKSDRANNKFKPLKEYEYDNPKETNVRNKIYINANDVQM